MSKPADNNTEVRFDNIAPISEEHWHRISCHIHCGNIELLIPASSNGSGVQLLPQIDDALVDEILENLDEEFGRKLAECLSKYGFAEVPDESQRD